LLIIVANYLNHTEKSSRSVYEKVLSHYSITTHTVRFNNRAKKRGRKRSSEKQHFQRIEI
jgi:hypothetical protein